MTDATYSTQQHGQYITNKSFAEQIAKLESRVAALESAANNEGNFHDYKYAANALRQALADQKLADAFAEDFPNTWGKKKHTAPPSKPWVSLTDEEVSQIYCDWLKYIKTKKDDNLRIFVLQVEAKLKEKNT